MKKRYIFLAVVAMVMITAALIATKRNNPAIPEDQSANISPIPQYYVEPYPSDEKFPACVVEGNCIRYLTDEEYEYLLTT